MASEILIDGTRLSWQDFAEQLIAFRSAPLATEFGHVRAPVACEAEARRLIRHLDLSDRIAIAGGPSPTAAPLGRRTHRAGAVTSAQAAIRRFVLGRRTLRYD